MTDASKPNGEAGAQEQDGVRSLKAASLEASAIAHGFFLRTGGVSKGIYASLNCGRGSGDGRADVEENRLRAAAALGAPSEALIGPRQVHSAKAVIATAPWSPADAPEADAIVTATPNLAIGVLTADCVPLLMADPVAGVIAAVHAGWRGAKEGVIESALDAMESLGARAFRISAAVGPAISQAAYEVGPEFKAAFTAGHDGNEKYFSNGRGGHFYFNLLGYVRDRLAAFGLASIQDVAVCTYENELIFSYRRSCHRSEPDYGRQISAIVLP